MQINSNKAEPILETTRKNICVFRSTYFGRYLFMNNTLFSNLVEQKNINVIVCAWEHERPVNGILFISIVVGLEKRPHWASEIYLAVLSMAISHSLVRPKTLTATGKFMLIYRNYIFI